MIEALALFVLGLFAWTFLEYLIHGWLSHTFRTFAADLHRVHHREPRAVFTIRAWIPLAILWLSGLALFRLAPGMILFSGALAGFAIYEVLHYRIHFCTPRSALERGLRNRHLAHHLTSPNHFLGVSSPLWDLTFGTEPLEERGALASFASVAPLSGPSNLHLLWRLDYLRHPLTPRRV